jgi:hypothetical protein
MEKRSKLVVGLVICIGAAALMIVDVVNVAWGAAIGVVGVGLIGAAATTTPIADQRG